MKSIKKIVVPTDFSDVAANAFIYALLLADKLGAEIQLLHCIHPGMAVAEMPTYSIDISNRLLEIAQDNMLHFTKEGLTSVLQQVKSMPLVSDNVVIGSVAERAQAMVKEEQYDLVVMGTQGATTTWDHLFGSLASGVLMNAPCPVLIVPEKAKFTSFKKICYATDLEGFEVYAGQELVAAFRPMVADLHFIHVTKRGVEEAPFDFELVDLLYNRKDLPFKVTATEVVGTDISTAIIEEAEKLGSNLIVMSRPHYSFFDQLFHKSKTREVALHTHLPLLVLNEGPEMTAGFN